MIANELLSILWLLMNETNNSLTINHIFVYRTGITLYSEFFEYICNSLTF